MTFGRNQQRYRYATYQRTGMIKAISESLILVIPESAGHFMSVITAFISMPSTYVLTNDAF